MILEKESYFAGWLEGQQCSFSWWESLAFQGKMLLSQWGLWKHRDWKASFDIASLRGSSPMPLHRCPTSKYFSLLPELQGSGRLWGCQTLRRLLSACCHCQLKGLGNGNLLRKMCNICNLAAFLPDSLPQQWTMVSRCSHELKTMENPLTFLHLSSPSALPAATKPTCFLSKCQQDKAVPSSRWQEDDGEIHRARKAPWSWILAICATRAYQPSLQAVRPRKKFTFELPGINWGRYSRSRKDYWI